MSQPLTNSEEDVKTIADVPAFNRINDPVIDIKDRMIRVTLGDVDDNKVELTFQPYQALKLTTYDCYLSDQSVQLRNNLIYRETSTWLGELKNALRSNDEYADFMDKALHFTIPAGDDVLEIAAWKVDITHLGKTTVFPPL